MSAGPQVRRSAGPQAWKSGGLEAERPPDRRTARPPDGGNDIADLLRQVRRIELRTERLVSSLAAGRIRSTFKGSGLEFDEVREYTPGDDVRAIDWNVTARAGRPHVKVFREERELTTWLLVDASGSMRFGAIPGVSPRTKLALAAEAAAVIAVTSLRNRDPLGLMRVGAGDPLRLAPRRGRGHCLRIIRELLAVGDQRGGDDAATALEALAARPGRRGACFVVSDFLVTDDHATKRLGDALARLARRHDVIALRIADPAEARLPGGGAPLVVQDPEGGVVRTIANGAWARAEYARRWQAMRERAAGLLRAAGCDLVDLGTDQPAFVALRRYFDRRMRRVRT
jgi:uncharacterized protein (DUF58 family)